MTREEQIIQASDEWTYRKPPQYSELVHKTHKVMCAYQVGFIDGAVWADAHPHWISVEDELPKETNMYIVVHHNVVCTMTWYDNLKEWADIYVDENECVQSRQMDGVTHWMPLPEPPKKGGEQ